MIGRTDGSVATHFVKFHKDDVHTFEQTRGPFEVAVCEFRNARTNNGQEGRIDKFLQGYNKQHNYKKPHPIVGIKIFLEGFLCQKCLSTNPDFRMYTTSRSSMLKHFKKYHNGITMHVDGNVVKGTDFHDIFIYCSYIFSQ